LERGAQQVVGIDIDPETLERARENLAPYDAPSNAWLRKLAEIANLSTNRARAGKPPLKLSKRRTRQPSCGEDE